MTILFYVETRLERNSELYRLGPSERAAGEEARLILVGLRSY